MTDFEVFRFYMAIKAHFTRDSYDYFSYKGHTKGATEEAFEKRKDKYRIQALAKKHTSSEIRDIFLSNLISDPKWTLFDAQTDTRFKKFVAYKAARSYNFTNEVDKLYKSSSEKNMQFDDIFTSANGFLPVLGSYLSKEISIDTLIILDIIHPFMYNVGQFEKELCKTAIKYKPFVKIDTEKFLQIEDNIYEKYFHKE